LIASDSSIASDDMLKVKKQGNNRVVDQHRLCPLGPADASERTEAAPSFACIRTWQPGAAVFAHCGHDGAALRGSGAAEQPACVLRQNTNFKNNVSPTLHSGF